MLFSKLLRVHHSPGMTKIGRIACLYDFQQAWTAFSLRPSSSCSSDKLWGESQHKYEENAGKCFRGHDQKISNFSATFTNTTMSKRIYSSVETVISRKLHTANSRFLSSLSSSTLPKTARPTVIFQIPAGSNARKEDNFNSHQVHSVRLFSSQGKDVTSEINSKVDGKDSSGQSGGGNLCQPPISTVTIKDGFQTRDSVSDFLSRLTEDQKKLLYHSLNVEVLRDKYEGHLGSSMLESHHYLSRFGRPTAALSGKEDPTGTLCEVSPKWLHARLDEKSPPASAGAVWAAFLVCNVDGYFMVVFSVGVWWNNAVGVKNALPFIGFGFLDNLIMILAGDYIDITLGTWLGISTMAAAALGNTISDVAGIGSAWYIEEFASKIGIKDPVLTPSQVISWPIRWASNGGRAIGVVIGCLLGMVPLLFLPSAEEEKGKIQGKATSKADAAQVEQDSLPKDKK